MAKLVTLIETSERRGRGVDSDPVRIVAQWFTVKGALVAERDPWLESEERRRMDPLADEFVNYMRRPTPANPRDTLNTVAKP